MNRELRRRCLHRRTRTFLELRLRHLRCIHITLEPLRLYRRRRRTITNGGRRLPRLRCSTIAREHRRRRRRSVSSRTGRVLNVNHHPLQLHRRIVTLSREATRTHRTRLTTVDVTKRDTIRQGRILRVLRRLA